MRHAGWLCLILSVCLAEQSAQAIGFLRSALDQASEDSVYVTHDEGLLCIVQPLSLESSRLEDAYLDINGVVVPGAYDFRLNAIVFLLRDKADVRDGLQLAEVAVKGEGEAWKYKTISFWYDGTAPEVSSYQQGDQLRVSVYDPDGFNVVSVTPRDVEIPFVSPLSFDRSRTYWGFSAGITGDAPAVTVVGTKPVLRFVEQLRILREDEPHLARIPGNRFLRIRDQVMQISGNVSDGVTCPDGQRCAVRDLGLALGGIDIALRTAESAEFSWDGQGLRERLREAVPKTCSQEITAEYRALANAVESMRKSIADEHRRGERAVEIALYSISPSVRAARNAWLEAQRAVTDGEQEFLRVKNDLNRIRARCWIRASSFAGASAAPTGVFMGSDFDLRNQFGGRIHLTNSDLFHENLEKPATRDALKHCESSIGVKVDALDETMIMLSDAYLRLDDLRFRYLNVSASPLKPAELLVETTRHAEIVWNHVQASLEFRLRECENTLTERELQASANEKAKERIAREQKRVEADEHIEDAEIARRQQLQAVQNRRISYSGAYHSEVAHQRTLKRERDLAAWYQEQLDVSPLAQPYVWTDNQGVARMRQVAAQRFAESAVNRGFCHCATRALGVVGLGSWTGVRASGSEEEDPLLRSLPGVPGVGAGGDLAKGGIEALLRGLYGVDQVPDRVVNELFLALGGRVFNRFSREQKLPSAGEQPRLSWLLAQESVKLYRWRGRLVGDMCQHTAAEFVFLQAPVTGTAAAVIGVDGCSPVSFFFPVDGRGDVAGPSQVVSTMAP